MKYPLIKFNTGRMPRKLKKKLKTKLRKTWEKAFEGYEGD